MAMIPKIEMFLVSSKHNPTANAISAMPLKNTSNLWLGRYLGIILKYALGFTKCMMPAKKYIADIKYKCHG